MSRLVDDVKSGLKGVRGAGDAVRGGLMEATDEVFDNRHDPTTQASQQKNHAIAEKGRQDLRQTDEMVGRREREKESRHTTAHATAGHVPANAPNAPAATHAPAYNTTTAPDGPAAYGAPDQTTSVPANEASVPGTGAPSSTTTGTGTGGGQGSARRDYV